VKSRIVLFFVSSLLTPRQYCTHTCTMYCAVSHTFIRPWTFASNHVSASVPFHPLYTACLSRTHTPYFTFVLILPFIPRATLNTPFILFSYIVLVAAHVHALQALCINSASSFRLYAPSSQYVARVSYFPMAFPKFT